MPTYEYRCEGCNCEFEQKQSFSDTSDASCPKCGHKAQRLFIPVPIIFKGSGFYVTDHRSDAKSAASKFDPSKPETKPEPKAAEPAKPAAGSASGSPSTCS